MGHERSVQTLGFGGYLQTRCTKQAVACYWLYTKTYVEYNILIHMALFTFVGAVRNCGIVNEGREDCQTLKDIEKVAFDAINSKTGNKRTDNRKKTLLNFIMGPKYVNL